MLLGKLLKTIRSPRPAAGRESAAEVLARGSSLMQAGAWEEAAACFEQALRDAPEDVELLSRLGLCHVAAGQLERATPCFERTLRIDPDFALAHIHFGNLAMLARDAEGAMARYRVALQTAPRDPNLLNNLGMASQTLGLVDEAIGYYRRALELEPRFRDAHSNLLCCMNLSPRYSADAMFREYQEWSAIHEAPLAGEIRPHPNARDPDRRLRIGYVSPDFRRHAVAYFIEPLLANHDRDRHEIYCYYNSPNSDQVTARLRGLGHHWRDVAGVSDAALAERVREDGIDILVDLAGHTRGDRLLAFARKPAPVQVTYLGYPNTSGMRTIDYRLTDDRADPGGFADRYHCERLARLPRTQWCYLPDAGALPVNALPASSSGGVTFGSFNNIAKIGDAVILAWSRILRLVPGSTLLMTSIPGESARARIAAAFSACGVDGSRLELPSYLSDRDFWRVRHRVDIALDPFPYNGTTSTCEALWTGLPVITLAGTYGPSRTGASLLAAVGLEEFVAQTVDQYVDLAAGLAGDLQRVQSLRSSLRERMRNSPLMDPRGFTRALETLYRGMWKAWLAGFSPAGARE